MSGVPIKVQKVMSYRCPMCGKLYQEEAMALDCLSYHRNKIEEFIVGDNIAPNSLSGKINEIIEAVNEIKERSSRG